MAAEALDRRATVFLDTEVQDVEILATEALQAITFHHSIHPSQINSSKSVSPSSGTGAPGSIVLPSGTGHSHPSHPASGTGYSDSDLPSRMGLQPIYPFSTGGSHPVFPSGTGSTPTGVIPSGV